MNSNFCDDSSSEDEVPSTSNKMQDDFKSLTFEEIMKLKDELGGKVYNEAVFGANITRKKKPKDSIHLKRSNKNAPHEISSKRQVPFLGAELRAERAKKPVSDPRFDEKSGMYNADAFKQNYKFVSKIRTQEVIQLKKQLSVETAEDERKKIKSTMQRLVNKNVEQRKWQVKHTANKKEQKEIQKAHREGRQPHYATKKERRIKELVTQFENLKKTGKLNKHLEKRRKKNTAKDRKKISLD